jgi:DNA-binding transcriptional MerR regulator
VNIIFDEEELTDSDDEDFEETQQDQASNATKNLTGRQRQDIYEDLLQRSKNGKLRRTDTAHVATKFNVQLRTVQRIWQRAKKCKAQGIPVDVKSLKSKNCGRKKIQVDLTRVADIPLNRRGTIRSLANALGVKKSTLHRWFKEGLLRRHSSAIRPYLKEANKKDRLRWCVSMLDPSTLPNDPKF